MTDPGRTVILVHGRCADGLTSAGLLRKRFPAAEVVYTHPSELRNELAAVAKRSEVIRVVLADLSPQAADLAVLRDSLVNLAKRAEVTWIDHHAPQWTSDFEAAVRSTGATVVLDRTGTESGASLAARWAGERDPGLLRVADLIRLRDAWVEPHNPDARAWTLLATELDAAYVDRLAPGELGGLEEQGRALLAAKEASIERSLAAVNRISSRVALLWGEDDISDVADRLFRSDVQCMLLARIGPSGRVSLRSRSGKPAAVRLAQRFGGGGHDSAAGFTLPLGFWSRLRLKVLRRRAPEVARVLAAAEAVVSGQGIA